MAGTIKEARLSGADRALRVFARGMVAVVQRPVVHGPKPVLDGPAIFIGRHVGLMDPVILMVQYYHQLLHPLVALDYYEKNAFTRAFYTHAQCIPVDRKNHSQQWLEDSLQQIAMETSNQICIVTMNDFGGLEKAQMAYTIGDKWGVGKADKDNGVVILIKPKTPESKGEAFIAPGFGLEGVIDSL